MVALRLRRVAVVVAIALKLRLSGCVSVTLWLRFGCVAIAYLIAVRLNFNPTNVAITHSLRLSLCCDRVPVYLRLRCICVAAYLGLNLNQLYIAVTIILH